MKFNFTLLLVLMMGSMIEVGAQSVMELKEKKAEIEAKQAEAQAIVDGFQAEIDALNSEIDIVGGWQKGLVGSVGLGFGAQNNWASSANPNSSQSNLNIGINAFANSIREDDFWRNKGVVALGWQSLDTDTNDDESDGFLDDRTVDIMNLSSLYGRNISDTWALSALGELNSSVFNLFNPGTLDLGVGLTWNPNPDLVVVIHPLNYHVAFSSVDGVSSEGALGAKLRADYNHTFANGLGWSSTLTSFIPYSSTAEGQPTLFEYTWLNSLNYTVWNGIGLNLSFGLRNAEFESTSTQTYYTVGVSYGF